MSKMADLYAQLMEIRNGIAEQAALAWDLRDIKGVDYTSRIMNRKLTDMVEKMDELLA